MGYILCFGNRIHGVTNVIKNIFLPYSLVSLLFPQSICFDRMPLFNKRFDAKPMPIRAGRYNIGCPPIIEDLDEYKNVSLLLGNKELKFNDGIWIHSTKKGDIDDITRMNRKMKTLESENNLIQVKMEVLLDMLTENVLQLNAMKGEARQ